MCGAIKSISDIPLKETILETEEKTKAVLQETRFTFVFERWAAERTHE